MEISTLYQIFNQCNGVTTDSRHCPKGSLFIALKGDTFNGNAFAAKALESGCAYAVIDEAEYLEISELSAWNRRSSKTVSLHVRGR